MHNNEGIFRGVSFWLQNPEHADSTHSSTSDRALRPLKS